MKANTHTSTEKLSKIFFLQTSASICSIFQLCNNFPQALNAAWISKISPSSWNEWGDI